MLFIYYFFKGLKPFNSSSNMNRNLGWLLNNCEPADYLLIKKIYDEESILQYIKYSINTGKVNPHLQKYLLSEYQIFEGNQSN
tara:strand:+ start:341 stop:589 length:249 start_codon:yes stop_codon:yes gene_type:complete